MSESAGSLPNQPVHHNFGETAELDLTFRSLPGQIRSDAVRPVAVSLVGNLERVASVWALPVDAVYWGSVFGQLHTAVFAALYGTGMPNGSPNGESSVILVITSPDGTITPVRVDRVINLSALSAQERNQFHQIHGKLWNFWMELAAPIPDQQVHNAAWTLGSNYLKDLAKLPSVSQGLAATLENVVLGVWTAFETLASDLWVAAVNAHPRGLGLLEGAPTRIGKKAGNSSAEENDPAPGDAVNKKVISVADMHRLTRGTFDMRECVGELLKRRFKFTTLSGIREAYSVAFSTKEKLARTGSLDDALSSKSLDAICAVRNLIVHKAGFADEQYQRDVKGVPSAPKVATGRRLELDGKDVVALTGAVIVCCTNLAKAVDTWLTLTGASDAGKNARDQPSGA